MFNEHGKRPADKAPRFSARDDICIDGVVLFKAVDLMAADDGMAARVRDLLDGRKVDDLDLESIREEAFEEGEEKARDRFEEEKAALISDHEDFLEEVRDRHKKRRAELQDQHDNELERRDKARRAVEKQRNQAHKLLAAIANNQDVMRLLDVELPNVGAALQVGMAMGLHGLKIERDD